MRKCINWDQSRGRFSQEVNHSANRCRTKPRKLEMPTQHSDSKLVYGIIVDGALSRLIAMIQLKTLCLNEDKIKLIANCTTLENVVKKYFVNDRTS